MKFHSQFPLLHPHWDYEASAFTILYTAEIQLRLLDVLHAQGSEAESPVLTDKPFLLWLNHPYGTQWMIGEYPSLSSGQFREAERNSLEVRDAYSLHSHDW